MAENKKYFWLKLKDDFFKTKEIKKLRKIAGGDTYTIIYLKMQLLSIKNEGKLYFEGIEDNFIDELSLELDEPSENIEITLNYLKMHNLIEESTTDSYLLPKVLSSIGKESDSAERVRRHRAIKDQEKKMLQCNEQVTTCNTEKEKEKEIYIELEKEIEIDLKEIETHWNSKNRLTKIRGITKKRKDKTLLRIKETSLKEFLEAIDKLNNSDFATGENKNNWEATYDWLVENDTNILKVLEGNYDNKTTVKEKKSFTKDIAGYKLKSL